MKKIGLYVECKRAWGRQVAEGVAAFARTRGDWALEMVERSDIVSRGAAGFDGFIARITDSAVSDAMARAGVPVADIYGGAFRAAAGVFRAVWQDNTAVGQMAARHFIEHRFSRFAYCGYSGERFSDERQNAFVRCLRLNHFDCSVYDAPRGASKRLKLSISNNDERIGVGVDSADIARWLKTLEVPCAVFCANDVRAYHLRKACEAASLSVPQDIAILGVDNDSLVCNFMTPPLSSIDPDAFGLGFAAAEFLQRRLDGEAGGMPRQIAPRELVVRESTQTFPVDPAWLSDALVFIRRNIGRHISAADVYEHVKHSHSRVNLVFREKLGTSVQKEIRRVALSEAKRLLSTTRLTVAEISKRVGFASQQYFCNVFTDAFGQPPSTMRQP